MNPGNKSARSKLTPSVNLKENAFSKYLDRTVQALSVETCKNITLDYNIKGSGKYVIWTFTTSLNNPQ